MTHLVCIGDIHEHPGPRNADRLRALDQILREGPMVPQLGAWVLCGDLFHTKSDAAGRNALDERIQRMADSAPVIVIKGNHDQEGELEGFGRLRAKWPIVVFTRPHVRDIVLATGETAAVFGLPYPQKGGLVGAGITPGAVVATADTLLDPIFMEAAGHLEAARRDQRIVFMAAHANIRGSISSSGQPQVGQEIEVTHAHLERLGPMLKVFGHIHRAQEVSGAIYVGSICRLDYAEIEEKRYLLVEIDYSGYRHLSRPIDVAPMFHIDGGLTRDGFVMDPIDGVDYRPGAIDWTGADIRVRYRYKASERAILPPLSTIEALFPGALRLKLEGLAEVDRDLRSPEVAAAKTLSDKLAAYAQVEQLDAETLTQLALLERADRDALLAQVADDIKAIETPAPAETVAA